MTEEIKENYDIPSDLKFVSRPWWGLSWKEAGILLSSILIAAMWWNLCKSLGLGGSPLLKLGIVCIAITAVGLIWLHLDMWMYHAIKWAVAPYYVTRFDKAAKQVSGIIGIEGDHYWNVDGDVCAILRLTALNSNRVDPNKADDIEKADTNFLNSLPCPVQIVGYTYDYDISKYISSMLSYANDLPKKVMKYRVAHLNFYQKYVSDQNIRERVIFMIIKADAQLSDPLETLDINESIISKNLVRSGVIGRRLIGSEIQTTMTMIATGVGEEGLEYLTPYTEVEAL